MRNEEWWWRRTGLEAPPFYVLGAPANPMYGA